MILQNEYYIMTVSDSCGSLTSFCSGGKECIANGAENKPLFAVRFLDHSGKPVVVTAKDSMEFEASVKNYRKGSLLNMNYRSIGGLPVNVNVNVTCPEHDSMTYWNLDIENNTDYYIEWIDFPDVVVPDDLVASGGDSKILWPAMEGVLIEDADLRENSWLKYSPIGYPCKGWEGYYPGPCTSQFMAYYGKNGGLYFGAHDENYSVKSVEFYKYDGGIRLEYRLFPGGIQRGLYQMPYKMVLGAFSGDWYDAATIYRKWYEDSGAVKPPKLYQNQDLPVWMDESPVVVIYPVRGEKDTGDMSPNEYFPYVNALPHLNRLSDSLGSKIMALLMHWEGTAPWSPPYVWPPYGGKDAFCEFVDGLHEQGNLAGVYCSGIAWTDESVLVPEYNMKTQFEELGLTGFMCTSPEGELPNSLICNGPIRWGYDMCPANKFVEEVAAAEVSRIVESGCDYIQFFDQNLGGASYFCYSKEHGHPPAPGNWQVEAMVKLCRKLNEVAAITCENGKKVVIGCESAAAEPYMPFLPFNDLRFNIHLCYGTPVPVYAYIYHEYINNFMGNQNGVTQTVNVKESPYNLLQRLAYSFAAGDMFSVTLKDGGDIHWAWCTEWTVEKPDQDTASSLIKNLNAWRVGAAKPFLHFGRMEKPYKITGVYDIPMILHNDLRLHFQSLFTSRWSSPDGRNIQMVVNYTPKGQVFKMELEEDDIVYKNSKDTKDIKDKNDKNDKNDIKVYFDPEGRCIEHVQASSIKTVGIPVEPLSAIMLEF